MYPLWGKLIVCQSAQQASSDARPSNLFLQTHDSFPDVWRLGCPWRNERTFELAGGIEAVTAERGLGVGDAHGGDGRVVDALQEAGRIRALSPHLQPLSRLCPVLDPLPCTMLRYHIPVGDNIDGNQRRSMFFRTNMIKMQADEDGNEQKGPIPIYHAIFVIKDLNKR